MSRWQSWFGVELNVVSSREKVISAIGGCLAIFCLILITRNVLHLSGASALVASMGASAVLMFGVPHGSLSQPWPVFAGHGISALIGVLCAKLIHQPELAAACAVGLSIGAMHQFKCIHPPGGATALTAVLGGEAVHSLGFHFVLYPVLLNCVVMIAIAVGFNAFFGWRRYPAILNRRNMAAISKHQAGQPTHEEIVAALRKLDSFVDITEEDLLQLCQILAPGKQMPVAPQRKVRSKQLV